MTIEELKARLEECAWSVTAGNLIGREARDYLLSLNRWEDDGGPGCLAD